MVQTMLKLVTSHEPIFRVASKTESMGHISVPPLYAKHCCTCSHNSSKLDFSRELQHRLCKVGSGLGGLKMEL